MEPKTFLPILRKARTSSPNTNIFLNLSLVADRMSDQLNNQAPSEDEHPRPDARKPISIHFHDGLELELEAKVEYSDDGSTIVNIYRRGSVTLDLTPTQLEADARQNPQSSVLIPPSMTPNPSSPHPVTNSQGIHLQTMARHFANIPIRQNGSLPRNEGTWNLHELANNAQQQEEVEAELPTPPPPRSERIWNFAELHETIRFREENDVDPPTPPPPYREAITMPPHEDLGGQAHRRPNDRHGDEAPVGRTSVPGGREADHHPDSPRTEMFRTPRSGLLTPALTPTPPPTYRFPFESPAESSRQARNFSDRFDVVSIHPSRSDAVPEGDSASEATDDARDSAAESGEPHQSSSDDMDYDQTA